jgi:predicted ferric reductase
MDSRGTTGITALAAVAVGNLVLWLLARPPGESTGRFLGELCGAEAVLLFVCSLVLATVLPPIEWAFGGLDRVARWHRRVATAGVLLLVPHIVLVTSPPDPYATSLGHGLGDVALFGLVFLTVWALAPSLRAARWPGLVRRLARATYERWLTAHRLTGLFVAVALVHGATVDVVLHRWALLRATYLIVGGIGVAAYLYRELLARYVIPAYQYTVAAVERPNATTVNVSLDPVRDPITFTAGQFVFVAFGGRAAGSDIRSRLLARRRHAVWRFRSRLPATLPVRSTRSWTGGYPPGSSDRSAASTTAAAAGSRSGSPAASESPRS